MKVVIIILGLVVLSTLFFVCFYKPPLTITFQVAHVSSDTTFQNPIWDISDGYGRNISLRAVGELDDSTEVFLKVPDHSDQFLKVQLPKGKFDTTWTGEYYEKQANVVFKHKKAKRGKVNIVFSFLVGSTDALNTSK